MQAPGVIALTSLLAVSTGQAADVTGKGLVDKLFADCDAALSDPDSLLQLAPISSPHPAMVTGDGRVFNVVAPVDGFGDGLMGMSNINATVLPGGTSVGCMISLHGGSVPNETSAEMRGAAIANAEALIGNDAVRFGGAIGGPALLTAAIEGMALSQGWASPDFPPTSAVVISTSGNIVSVVISRYQAAP